MLWEPGVVGSNPIGAIHERRAVAQWQSTVTTLIHNFVGHSCEYVPTAGAEYMANDRFGLAGSNPVPPARDVSGGFSAHTSLGHFFRWKPIPLYHFWDFNLSISTRSIQSPPVKLPAWLPGKPTSDVPSLSWLT